VVLEEDAVGAVEVEDQLGHERARDTGGAAAKGLDARLGGDRLGKVHGEFSWLGEDVATASTRGFSTTQNRSAVSVIRSTWG